MSNNKILYRKISVLFILFTFIYCSNFKNEKYLKNNNSNIKFEVNKVHKVKSLQQQNYFQNFGNNISKKITSFLSNNTSLGFFSKAAIFTSVLLENVWNNKVSADYFIRKINLTSILNNGISAESVLYSSNNSYIMGGEIRNVNSISLNNKVFIGEIDDNGNNIWAKYYQLNITYPDLDKIIETYDKNYTFLVTSQSSQSSPYKLILGKIFPNGNSVWFRNYGIDTFVSDTTVLEMENNNLVIVGRLTGGTFLFKTDNRGYPICNLTLENYVLASSSHPSTEGIYKTSNNNLIVVGGVPYPSPVDSIITLIDSNCSIIWSKTIDFGPVNSKYISVLENANGNFQVLGEEDGNAFTQEISPQGHVLFESILIAPQKSKEDLYSIKRTNTKALAIIGYGDDNSGNSYKFIRGQINENGEFNTNFGYSPFSTQIRILDVDRNIKERIVAIGDLNYRNMLLYNLPNGDFLSCEEVRQIENFPTISITYDSNLTTGSIFFNITDLEVGYVDFDFLVTDICLESESPTLSPTFGPISPTDRPTNQPTDRPTNQPTDRPTNQPTDRPTNQPTDRPTNQPTDRPTENPSLILTDIPTVEQTLNITQIPTTNPTDSLESSSEEELEEGNNGFSIIGLSIVVSLTFCLCLFCLLFLIFCPKKRSIIVDS